MKTFHLRFTIPIITLLFPFIAQCAFLKLKLNQGDQYKSHVDLSINARIVSTDTITSMMAKIATDNKFNVKGLNNQVYDVDVAITRMQMKLMAPKKDEKSADFLFDTDSIKWSDSLEVPSLEQMKSMKEVGLMMKYIMGINIPLKISSNGKIMKMGNINKTLKPAIGFMNRRLALLNLPVDSIEKIRARQNQLLRQSDLSFGYEKSCLPFPDKSINPGDTWQEVSTMPNDTATKIMQTYKLLEITNTEYIIELISGQAIPSTNKNIFAGLFNVKIGSVKAIYHLDKETCWMNSAEGLMAMSIVIGDSSNDKKGANTQNAPQKKGLEIMMSTSYKITSEQ